MLGIFSGKKKYATISIGEEKEKSKKEVSSNLWEKCPECDEIVYKKDIDANLKVCPKCNYYFRMSAAERIALLIDKDTFEEYDDSIVSKDYLEFYGYQEKLESSIEKTGLKDAVVSGVGKLNGIQLSIAAMDFEFMGGSMGSVVGEKITRTIERGIEKSIPVVVVSSSGGARMQEGILSLMQMAKTSAALEKLREKKLPFISIPVNPTTGGVTASFAMLGDVIMSEPNALIAFAGPRVIEQTIRQKLPEGFQKSEFLLEHGMLDIIVKRKEMKNTLYSIIKNLLNLNY